MSLEEKRIYVVLAATVQPDFSRTVVQPPGRQIAQACHVVSKLRHHAPDPDKISFEPITTIILQARDTKELIHIYGLLNYEMTTFQDENFEAYGPKHPTTALAVLATPSEVKGILDYLPLWGSQ